MGNEVRFRTDVDDKASAKFKSLDKQLDSTGLKSGGLQSALAKLGPATGGLVTPANLATAGVLALGGVLLSSAKKAAEEETGIIRLTTSLKANVPAWDGNTKAIEDRIRAGEEMAFSDGDLRDSLALLVGATHDVNKAFEIQQTAMDLARFKGISLKDASEALTKVEAGSFRILKSLGIELKNGATQTEALAAVQKVAAGQAVQYAESSAGAFDKTQIALDDLQETLGRFVLPKLVELTGVIKTLVRLTDDWTGSLSELRTTNPVLADVTQKIKDLSNPFAIVTQDIQSMQAGVDGLTRDLGKFSDSSVDATEKLKGSGGFTSALGDTSNHVLDTSEKVKSLAFGTFGALKQGAIDTTGVVKLHFTGMARGVEIAMQKTKQSVKDDINGLAQYTQDRLSDKALQNILTGKGSLGAKLEAGLKDKRPDVRQAAIKIRDDLQDILDARLGVTVTVTEHDIQHKALGGPVKKGEPYIVGEHRPELFVPNESGSIIPRVPNGLGGGGDVTLVYAPQFSTASASEAQRFMQAIAKPLTIEMNRQRLL